MATQPIALPAADLTNQMHQCDLPSALVGCTTQFSKAVGKWDWRQWGAAAFCRATFIPLAKIAGKWCPMIHYSGRMVVIDTVTLVVADAGNNRVMLWDVQRKRTSSSTSSHNH